MPTYFILYRTMEVCHL